MNLTDLQKNQMMALYLKGLDAGTIANAVKAAGIKCDGADIASCIWNILRGLDEFVPPYSEAAFDQTDWTLREEFILRTMAGFKVAPARVAQLLGRGPDQCKRKLREMMQRDQWLLDYAKDKMLPYTKPKPDHGGVGPLIGKQMDFLKDEK